MEFYFYVVVLVLNLIKGSECFQSWQNGFRLSKMHLCHSIFSVTQQLLTFSLDQLVNYKLTGYLQ